MPEDLHKPSTFAPQSPRPRSLWARAALLLACSLGLPAAALGGDDGSWVGQKIMTKKAGTWIGHTGAFGRHVYVAELTDIVYKVLKEQDGWLCVRQGNIEDWLEKEQAVLLKEAMSYFTQRLGADDKDALAWAHRGRAWKEEGELEKALADLDVAIQLDPNSSRWFHNRGLVYDELEEYDRAIRDYDEAIRLEPRVAHTYNDRGLAHKARKEYDQAVWDYSQAIRLEPALSDAYFNRGNVHKARGAYDQAVRDYSEAIRLDPRWADAYFNRANANKARGAYDRAASDYSEVIRLDPQDADAYSSLAWLLATCPEEKVRDGQRAVA